MDPDSFYRWLIGTAVTLFGIGISLLWSVVVWVSKRIQTNSDAIKSGDDQLHARMTKLREDMTENYARKTDIDHHIARQEATMKEMRDEHREAWRSMDKKMDTMLSEMRNRR